MVKAPAGPDGGAKVLGVTRDGATACAPARLIVIKSATADNAILDRCAQCRRSDHRCARNLLLTPNACLAPAPPRRFKNVCSQNYRRAQRKQGLCGEAGLDFDQIIAEGIAVLYESHNFNVNIGGVAAGLQGPTFSDTIHNAAVKYFVGTRPMKEARLYATSNVTQKKLPGRFRQTNRMIMMRILLR
jgi:hypothetical protein